MSWRGKKPKKFSSGLIFSAGTSPLFSFSHLLLSDHILLPASFNFRNFIGSEYPHES